MKKSKKISVLISLVLILILALSAVSAADDVATEDVELASVDEVQTVDNTQTTDEIYTEPTDIIVTDTGDSGDLDDAEDDVISDTGQKDDSDDGDEAVVSDASSPKNALKAETNPDEPLRAPDGSFRDLNTLISNAQSGSTITLDRNYVYNPSTDRNYVDGITITKNLNINGNGFTIDGQGTARGLILNGHTSTSWLIVTVYHGYTYGLNNINFVNLSTTADAGAAIASHIYPNTVTITNCNFTNNRGNRGAVSVSVREPTTTNQVDTGSVTITGCIFKDNYASDRSGGGAIYSGISYDRTSITANNNVFINNTAAGYAQAIFYSNANYINVNYNWWGQNAWNNNFVAQSNNNRITPTYRYLADFTQTSGKTLELTLALNGGTAPSGSTLPARNASFSIDSGIVDPESEMFQGSIEVTYASLEDTTITANVDNQQFTLEVSKTPRENINELTITVADVVYPNQAQVIVDTDVRGTFNITIGDTVKEVNITNGQATIAWDSLPAGQYFAVVSCIGDIRYNDKFAYTSFKVEKQNLTITVTATPDTIVYGDGETVTLSSALNDTAATAGTVTYYVDGTESGTILDDLTIGTYVVIAKYTGDPNYNDAESVPITVTVAKPTPTISVTANPIMYGQDATITIGLKGLNDEGITGLVKVTIAGKEYGVAVNNGVGTLTVSGLAANEAGHPISVEFAGNANYNSANNFSTKQIVYKAQPIIGVTPVEISYGEDAVVNISLELPNGEKLDGVTVYATVDGEPYPVTINNGVGTLTVSDLIVDTYAVEVEFQGNDNYSSAETIKYGSIVVKRATIDVTVGNVVVTRPATGTIVFTASAPGEYIVKVGDVEYQANVDFADVPVEIPVASMLAGSYDVKVTADETRNYEAVNETFTAAYVVLKRNLTIEATPNATEIAYGEEITLAHSISAPEGAVLTGDVTYYIDGEKAESIFTGSKVGTYTFTVSYTGDPDFNDAVSDPVTITVNKFTPIFYVVANNNTYGNNSSVSVFTIRNETIFGGIPNITVLVTVNNVTYAVVTTDFLGGVILYLNDLDANEEGYSISAVTLETDEYASVSNNTEVLKIYKVDTRLTIDSDRVSLDYGETSTLSHWITEGATGAVTYYLNGTAVPGNVLSNLMPGNYTVTAKYEGDKNYKPADSENTLDITVKKINPRLSVSANNTVIKYLDSIKLLRVFDTPASGEVVWYVNGTAQMSNIIENLKPGTYTVTAKYIEDEIYYDADSLNSLTITILKDDVDITVRSDKYRIPYGDSITLNSIIEPIEAWPWENEVIYIVDGRETSNPTVSGLGVGTHTIIAKYVENDYFNEAYSEAITVNVDKATPSIEVESDPVTYPNDAVVNFIVKGNNNVALPGVGLRVTINGASYYVETDNEGKVSLAVKGLNVGEYPIEAVAVANDNYGSATNNTEKIVVNKGDLTITAGTSASSVAYGDEISFTNTITAPEGAATSGTVTYYVDNEPITGDSISNLSVGTHSVVAKYTGDPNFNDAQSAAVPFTVTEAAIVVTGQSTSVIYPNKGNIVITTNVAGTYTIKVGDVTYEDVTLAAGENIFPVTDVLPVGDHAVKVSANIEDYQEITDVSIATYTVTKGDLTIAVNPNATNIKYGESVTLESTISAPEGAQTAGTVTYYVDGVAISGNTLPKLSVGTHTVVAKYTGDSNFNDAESASKTITVGKKTPIVDVFANPSYTYPNDVRFIVEVYDEGPSQSLEGVTVEVTVNEVTYVGVTGVDGTVEFTIKGLNVGEYTIYATSLENENYTSAQYNEEEFAVVKATATVTSGDVTVYYPANGKVNITASVPGTYTVKVGNDEYTATVTTAGGTATVDIPTLDVGEYGISVTADLGNNYNLVDTGVINTYTVSPGTLIVTVENVTVSYPNTGVVTVKSNVDGDYEVIVNSRVYWAHVVDGEGSVTVQKLNYGIYNIRVQGIIDNYETFNELVAKYTVTKGNIEVTAQDASVTYPQTSSIVITTDVAGTYTIKVGEDYSKDVELEAGENTVAIDSILDAGTYDVSVSATIDNYKPVEDKVVATYTVNKAQSTIDVTYEDGQFTITLDGVEGEKLSETVKVAIDGTAIDSIETDDGVYTFTYAGLAPGRHSILVTFEGNTNYLGDSKNYGFDVDKITPTLVVDIGNITYGQDAYIVASLFNGETPLNGVVEVTLLRTGTTYIVAVAEGSGILPIAGLNAGTYTYTAKSVADSTYESAIQDAETFVVAPRPVLIEVDTFGGVDFGDEGQFEVRLYDEKTDERIKDTVVLIFTDANGVEKARTTVETIVGPWERGENLEFTAEWPMGDYYVTVENPNYIFMGSEEGMYSFTSYGDNEGTIEYSTGTVEVLEELEDGWFKVKVLTNDADESYVGQIFYINERDDPWEDLAQLYTDLDEPTDIWVHISEIHIPLDTAKYDYPVHKIGIGVNLVSGDGGYVYGYDHEVVLKLIKYDGDDWEEGEPVVIDSLATVVVYKFNGETDEWEETGTITDLFEDGILSIDCSSFKPGEYKLKVSISDDTYEIRYWNDEEDREVDYRLFWDDGSLFQVDNDHLCIENVIGEESTRFGDEHDFSFEVWHSHYDEETDDDVRELFVHNFDATVKVYKWNDDTEEYDLVDTIPVEISGGKIQAIDFSELKVGHYKVTVTLDDPDYAFEEWDDDLSKDVDYAIRYFKIYQDNIHANVEGRDWTEYGQERIFKFDLTHWDDDAEEDVLFEYNTNAIVKVYKLTWDDEGVESAELIDTYSVAINDGHSEAIDLSDLNAGSYRVTIQLDDEDYALDYWFNGEYGIQEERFDVGRANVNITVEFDKDGYIYGDDVIVTVTITPQTTDEKLTEEIELNIMGKESIKKHLVDGVATFTLEDYKAALYTIWVNFKGTDNYNDIYNYIDSFIIEKASPVINVNPREEEYTYGGDVIIDVTLYDGDTGLTATAIVNVDGADYVVNIENGEGTLTISGLAANENGYGIAASVAATDNYNGAGYDGDAKVVVNKAQPTLDVAAIEMTYGESDELIITLDGVNGEKLSGVITVTVNEEDHDVTITDGVGTLPISGLNAGRYDVTASFTGNDNYKSDEITKSIAIIVKKADPTITVDANATAIKYGESIKLTSEVTPTSGGAVTYYLGETALDSDVLSDLTPRTYTVVAKVAETDNYNEASSEALTITVAKADASIEVKIADDELTFGESTTLSNVITPEGLTGEVTYYVDGEVITGTTVSGLSVGTHTVVAKLAETDNYNAAESAAKTITVSKATPAIEITSDPVSYPNDAVVNIVLTGANNVALPGATIRVTVGGTTYAVTTDEEGKASLTVKGLGADIYDITAVSVADDNYESVTYTGDTKVVVNKATDAKLDVELVGDEIVVTLTGGDDTPLDGTVNLVIDDVTAIPVTITNGQGSYDASSLTAGTHTVEATSVADDNYESVSVSKEITKGSAPNEAIITVSVASIIYGQDAEIAVTLTDSEGNPVEGTLDVKVGETTKQVIIGTDGIGYVAFSDLTVGHYTATVSFAGDETYKPTSKEATFDVSKVGTVIESEDIVVTANVAGTMEFTLKDLNGNILAGRTVTLTFNGQTFNKTSDEDGKFTVDINMANQGTYTISASYAGEADYEASTASYDVVVKPIATKLTVVDVTYGLSETKYLTATLTAGDEPLANKIVTFSLNGKTYTGRTNATGVVRIAVSLTAKKTYSVVASYGGDTTYGSAMAIYKLKVVKS